MQRQAVRWTLLVLLLLALVALALLARFDPGGGGDIPNALPPPSCTPYPLCIEPSGP